MLRLSARYVGQIERAQASMTVQRWAALHLKVDAAERREGAPVAQETRQKRDLVSARFLI